MIDMKFETRAEGLDLTEPNNRSNRNIYTYLFRIELMKQLNE